MFTLDLKGFHHSKHSFLHLQCIFQVSVCIYDNMFLCQLAVYSLKYWTFQSCYQFGLALRCY